MSDEKPVVELFLKVAPIGKEDKGPCPISQQWFMAFYLLAEKEVLNLFVTTVNMDSPPEAFTNLKTSRRLPVARVIRGFDPTGQDLENLVCDTNDEIEQLVTLWKCPNLRLPRDSPEEAEAERAYEDVYKHLCNLLKNGVSAPLITALRRLDNYLKKGNSRYLLGDELNYADCQLMPRLHHVRIAAKAFNDLDIPFEFKHVWQYIEAMYATPAFVDSCPADRDIIFFYQEKAKQVKLVKPTLMDATKTLTVPLEVLDGRQPSYLNVKPSSADDGDFQERKLYDQDNTYSYDDVNHGGPSGDNEGVDNGVITAENEDVNQDAVASMDHDAVVSEDHDAVVSGDHDAVASGDHEETHQDTHEVSGDNGEV